MEINVDSLFASPYVDKFFFKDELFILELTLQIF